MRFSEIIGQNALKNQFIEAIKNNTPSQAYIIEGEKKSGKKLLADTFAMALLCEEDGIEPCGECHACKMAASNNHPDIIHVKHEKDEIVSVKDIREQLIGDTAFKPYYGGYKIYIVDEAEKMNASAQNALLKTLEDPPEYVIILLLTTQSGAFLPTILSRCIKLNIEPIGDDKIISHLIENEGVYEEDATFIAAFARGNFGRAIDLAGSEEFNNTKKGVVGLLAELRKKTPDELLNEANILLEQNKGNIAELFDFFVIWYRDVLVYKSTADRKSLVYSDNAYAISQDAAKLSYTKINKNVKIINHARSQIKSMVKPEHVIGQMVLSLKK